MPGTKNNKNALKHGLYARRTKTKNPKAREPRHPAQIILALEDTLDAIIERLKGADDDKAFAALANSMSMASTAIFTGHRTITFMSGKIVPVEQALDELKALDFDDD